MQDRLPGLLPDTEVAFLATRHGMVQPFATRTEAPDTISYGLSSFGYDARLAMDVQIVDGLSEAATIDPKNPSSLRSALTVPRIEWHDGSTKGALIIPPHGFALGHTVETFSIPRDVLVICLGKSTYARCGLIVNVTPLEPGWSGQVTLELHNTTPYPIAVYPGEGICQFLFLRGAKEPATSYADRGGKYQGQRGVTLPRMPTEWVDDPWSP